MKALKMYSKVIEKEDGQYIVRIPPEYEPRVQEILSYCFEKRQGNVMFSLSPPVRRRTTGKNSQSAHFNGHCGQIAEVTGQPMDMVRAYMKSQAVTRGYPFKKDADGNPALDFYGNIIGQSEAEATVEECKLLIDEVHQFADEYGIKLTED